MADSSRALELREDEYRDAQERAEVLAEGPIFTDRQAEVYALREYGFTTAQIATGLGIQPDTVEEHLRRARRRLEAAEETLETLENPHGNEAETDGGEPLGDPEHQAVPGGFECECGATRRTPLGMARHRETCDEAGKTVHTED